MRWSQLVTDRLCCVQNGGYWPASPLVNGVSDGSYRRISGRQPQCSRQVKMTRCGSARRLLDHLVGSRKKRLRDGKAKRYGGLEVDDKLQPSWLLNRQVPRFVTP